MNGSASYSKGEGWPEKLGLKGVGGDGSMPVFTFSSDNYPKMALERWDSDVEENIMMRNNTTFIRGKHNIKVGFEARHQRWKPRRWRNQAGTFIFNFAGNRAQRQLEHRKFLRQFPARLRRYGQHQHADARCFRASLLCRICSGRHKAHFPADVERRAAVRPGSAAIRAVRPCLDIRPAARRIQRQGTGQERWYFSATGPGRIGSRTFEDTYYKAINPRLGLAYQLRRATVLRMGYGISHSSQLLLNDHMGFSTTQNFDTLDQGNTPAFLLDNGMPTNWPRPPFLDPSFGNNNNVSAAIQDDSARMPMTQNWRLDIQRELPRRNRTGVGLRRHQSDPPDRRVEKREPGGCEVSFARHAC